MASQPEQPTDVEQAAATVAHDINNLLAVIVNYAAVLARSPRLNERDRADLANIERAALGGARLTLRLLGGPSASEPDPEPIDVDALVRDVIDMLGATLASTISLGQQCEPGLTVFMNRGEIERVLVNLVLNASEAMADGGTITVLADAVISPTTPGTSATSTVQPGPYVRIQVVDTGAGMSGDVLDHAMEPFFTTKGDAGTGLGLAGARGIIDQAGGTIWLESVNGAGTTVTMLLPRLVS